MDRSGWCLKAPVTEWNQGEHDLCPLHFATRDCACECGHAGERSLEDRGMTYTPYIPAKKLKLDTGIS